MSIATGPAGPPQHPLRWWESRRFVLFIMLLTAIPLVWPNVAPLVDLPGHIGRYRVQLELASSPELQQFYTFHWDLIGNLGVDLLVQVFAPVFGLEPTVKFIVLLIPVLTVGGLLWIAHEVHGRQQQERGEPDEGVAAQSAQEVVAAQRLAQRHVAGGEVAFGVVDQRQGAQVIGLGVDVARPP